MKPSREAQRAYNLREKLAYHEYLAACGPVRGGQKGFRKLIRRTPVARRPLSLLSHTQRFRRETALRVLSRSRRLGLSLSDTAREAGTTPEMVRRYLGRSGFRKVGGRWRPTRTDTILRHMAFYEDGKRVSATVRGNDAASLLGKYDRDVRTFLEDPARDPSVLKKWEGQTFLDAQGRVHTFETNPARILLAVERAETQYGSFEVYPEAGEGEAALTEV